MAGSLQARRRGSVLPRPSTALEHFALFRDNWLVGLLTLDLLGMIAYLLFVPTILALYVALRRTSEFVVAIEMSMMRSRKIRRAPIGAANVEALLGLVSFGYKLIVLPLLARRHRYTVQAVHRINPEVLEVTLTPRRGQISFEPGQFVFVRGDAVPYEEFLRLAAQLDRLQVVLVCSEEQGHLRATDVGDLQGRDLFLCGPKRFTSDLQRQFLKLGVSRERIHFEDFEFR